MTEEGLPRQRLAAPSHLPPSLLLLMPMLMLLSAILGLVGLVKSNSDLCYLRDAFQLQCWALSPLPM